MSAPGIEPLDLRDPATAADVLALQRAAYRVEADLIGHDGIPALHESLEELIGDPARWWGVRDGAGVVAGVAVTSGARRCSIDKLVVAPSHHRRGLGRALVEHVLAALDPEIVEVSTGTLNMPARRLYESSGFGLVGVREIAPGVTVSRYERWHPKFATSFDGDVANYEASRPGYPDELYRALADVGLAPGARVLEVGPGPGTVTVELLDRGASVVAVEAGAAMAGRLRDRVAGRPCEVVEARFEEAEIAGPFDLAVAGTALHWVDLGVALPKLAAALRPGAWLAAWWNVHGPAGEDEDPIEPMLREVIGRYLDLPTGLPYARDVAARAADLSRTGHFELVEHRRFAWPWRHDAASLRALFASFSNVSTLPEPSRTELLDGVAAIVDERFGGTVERAYTTEVHLARRLEI